MEFILPTAVMEGPVENVLWSLSPWKIWKSELLKQSVNDVFNRNESCIRPDLV